MRVRLAAAIAGALLVAACTDTNAPVAPELLANRTNGHGDKAATDQYFFWLPPIFDGFTGWRVRNVEGLAPEVQIFACTATEGPACDELGAQVADLPASDGSGLGKWHQSLDHYLAIWNVDKDLAGDTYRVCVGLPQDGGGLTYLGHADVQVVNPRHRGWHRWGGRGHEGDWQDRGTRVLAGSTLPVKFKIGDGYQGATSDDGCAPSVSPATVTLTGTDSLYSVFTGTAYFAGDTVTVYDQSGNPVSKRAGTNDGGMYSTSFPAPAVTSTYFVCIETQLMGVELAANPEDVTTPPVCPAPPVGFGIYGHTLIVNPGDTNLTMNFGFALPW
jgi:hypothetical protein